MPTYSYRCDECGAEFERVQRMTEDPIRECAQCHKPAAKRQITSGNFILKGSGWYSDAYAGGSNKKTDAKTESAAKTDTTSGEKSTKTESTTTPAKETTSTSTAKSDSPAAPAK